MLDRKQVLECLRENREYAIEQAERVAVGNLENVDFRGAVNYYLQLNGGDDARNQTADEWIADQCDIGRDRPPHMLQNNQAIEHWVHADVDMAVTMRVWMKELLESLFFEGDMNKKIDDNIVDLYIEIITQDYETAKQERLAAHPPNVAVLTPACSTPSEGVHTVCTKIIEADNGQFTSTGDAPFNEMKNVLLASSGIHACESGGDEHVLHGKLYGKCVRSYGIAMRGLYNFGIYCEDSAFDKNVSRQQRALAYVINFLLKVAKPRTSLITIQNGIQLDIENVFAYENNSLPTSSLQPEQVRPFYKDGHSLILPTTKTRSVALETVRRNLAMNGQIDLW